jgi:hypothetical protein
MKHRSRQGKQGGRRKVSQTKETGHQCHVASESGPWNRKRALWETLREAKPRDGFLVLVHWLVGRASHGRTWEPCASYNFSVNLKLFQDKICEYG